MAHATKSEKRVSKRDSIMPRSILREQIEQGVEEKDLGIRVAFRITITVLAALAFLTIIGISYLRVTREEFARAGASVRSEVNYLCLQLRSLKNRADTFDRIADSLGWDTEELHSAESEDVGLLTDPVGDVLQGYTLAETGTVVIVADDIVVASDDDRMPVGGDLRELLGADAYGAIDPAISSEELQRIGLADTAIDSGDRNGYLLAGREGDYIIVIVEPSSMVYRNRVSTIGRETTITVIVLVVVFIVVDRMLIRMVARRIDMTNAKLREIVNGDLEARVPREGTREFKSLALGINVTVDALQNWIDEAETRMDAELATARAIQEAALPRTFPPYPDIPHFEIYAVMDPAREVGGDFYDFFLVGKGNTPQAGRLAFVMADVSGKGVPAALFMMKTKALIHEYVSNGGDLGAAVTEANRQIRDGNEADMFVTAWIGVLDYGTRHIEYVNAGHNPPLLRQGDTWQWLRKRSGPMLGLYDVTYRSQSIECAPGDGLVLYTDGVTEAFNVQEEQYGEGRLLRLLDRVGVPHPFELVRAVRHDVGVWAEGAEQSDDITIMALEVK